MEGKDQVDTKIAKIEEVEKDSAKSTECDSSVHLTGDESNETSQESRELTPEDINVTPDDIDGKLESSGSHDTIPMPSAEDVTEKPTTNGTKHQNVTTSSEQPQNTPTEGEEQTRSQVDGGAQPSAAVGTTADPESGDRAERKKSGQTDEQPPSDAKITKTSAEDCASTPEQELKETESDSKPSEEA